MKFVINGVELRNGGSLRFGSFNISSFFSRYFNQTTQTTVQEQLWTFIPDFSAVWSGNSYSVGGANKNYGYFRLYISGSQFRIATYSCSTCSNGVWSYGAWATAYTNGTFSNTTSQSYEPTFGTYQRLKSGTAAGGSNRLTLGTGTVYFSTTNGFTGSTSGPAWMYNALNISYLQTSGGKIRTHTTSGGVGTAGAWVSLT